MFYKKFNHLFQDVIVIGCGGTGSRVIPPLVQEVRQAIAKLNPVIHLVDFDKVESKNLSRQNFIETDLGRNKAEVLAERYSIAMDFPISHTDWRVDNTGDMKSIISRSSEKQGLRRLTKMPSLIIMCVDSIEARLEILSHCEGHDIIIDAGNEDTFGQVSIYNPISTSYLYTSAEAKITPFSGEYEIPFIPAPFHDYMNARVNPPKATGSCADLDQSLAINFMMASGIIAKVQNLAYNLPFTSRTDYFDLLNGNRSEKMTVPWLLEELNRECVYKSGILSVLSDKCATVVGKKLKTTMELVTYLNEDIKKNTTPIDPRILAALS